MSLGTSMSFDERRKSAAVFSGRDGRTAARPPLCRNELHVWWIPLDHSVDRNSYELLSHDERLRAAAFRVPAERGRFVRARAALREVLARYLLIPPHSIPFAYGAFGKPALAVDTKAAERLRFNLSHSEDFALLAVGQHAMIGVDVERMLPDVDIAAIAECCFSPEEKSQLLRIPEPLRREAFFKCWTRKEAYVKATGYGLSAPLRTFQVSFQPGDPAMLLSRYERLTDSWSMRDLTLAPEMAGAVVASGDISQINMLEWDPSRGIGRNRPFGSVLI